MKTSLAIAVALATGVGTSVFAQSLVKQDTITLALTLQGQASVSTSASAANAGTFSEGPLYYKTSSSKFTQASVLKAIAVVLHSGNANFYSTTATLELVQGELGGFWNISDGLAQSYPEYDGDGFLNGSFNDDGDIDYNPYIDDEFIEGELYSVFFPDDYDQYDYDYSGVYDFDDYIDNYVDLSDRTSIADGVNEYARLDTGRHFLPVPWESYADDVGVPYLTTGEYPVGHMQPWGQVYVKDPGHKDSSGNPLCENVTFFFDFEVQECYDCFYLSSFISDATFKNVAGTQSGPPCCTSPGYLTGKGTDHYYLSIDFDNTLNNSFLNPALEEDEDIYYYGYVGFNGLSPTAGVADGLTPDLLAYSDTIRSHLGTSSPYETRFSLHGLVTYNWTLKLINSDDVAADYIGTASYAANGYGFIGLVCDLITGTGSFTETAVKDVGCCDDEAWYYQTFNGEVNDQPAGTDDEDTWVTGWFGPGWDGGYGYFYPPYDEYNPYPYYNIVGGQSYDGDIYEQSLPDQYESPFNPPAALTRHQRDDGSSSINNENNSDVDNYIFEYGFDED